MDEVKQNMLTIFKLINKLEPREIQSVKKFIDIKKDIYAKEMDLQCIELEYTPPQSPMFDEFFESQIIQDPTDNILKLNVIYFEYKDWFKKKCGKEIMVPTRKELKAALNKKYTPVEGNKEGWTGIDLLSNLPVLKD
tara:strand:+ start:104 stop:514 length:411 start_codon:yes stop_codon:yes gene_type:complete